MTDLLESLASALCQAQCGPPGQGKTWSQVWDADPQPSTGRMLWLKVAAEALRQMKWAYRIQLYSSKGSVISVGGWRAPLSLAPPDWNPDE